jgi:MYXO-CTERM domain-containing protein
MKRTQLLALCGAACAFASFASAGIIGNPITVTVQNDAGVASFSVSLSECTYDAPSRQWYYIQQGSRPVVTTDGRTLGTFSGLSMFMQDDPAISLGFAMQGGSTPTLVTISSALLTFPTLTDPTAHSSAAMTITDTSADGTGVTMHGNNGGGFGYEANYNGLVPAGSIYSLHCPNFFTAAPGGSNSENDNNNAPIAGNVSAMSASWSFVITPFDSVSGTSNFSVTPAPGALALLGIGGLALSRRRR